MTQKDEQNTILKKTKKGLYIVHHSGIQNIINSQRPDLNTGNKSHPTSDYYFATKIDKIDHLWDIYVQPHHNVLMKYQHEPTEELLKKSNTIVCRLQCYCYMLERAQVYGEEDNKIFSKLKKILKYLFNIFCHQYSKAKKFWIDKNLTEIWRQRKKE